MEYIQENPFKPYMGTDENSIIQMKEDTVKRYQKITFALVNKLAGAGVTGASTLEGNEEAMLSRSFAVTVDKLRNAVRVAEMEEQISAIALRDAARATLKEWSMEYGSMNRVIAQLQAINGVLYGTATEAQKDAWLDDNLDRTMFGGTAAAGPVALSTTAPAGGATYDHSGTLVSMTVANSGWDSAGDAAAFLSRLKRKALAASPKIRPIRVGAKNRRYYVAFVNPRTMADIKADTVIMNAQKDVTLAEENNRLFQGGDVLWDGVIVHEVDNISITPWATAGASSIPLAPVYLCGAQAIGYAIAKRWKSVTETFDYGDKYGVAIETIDAIAKMVFGSNAGTDTGDLKDHGVATGYHAVVATI
jgi:hypothetical protein